VKASYFVFKKVKDETPVNHYQLTHILSTRSELRKYLDAQLNTGLKAEDFLTIYGTEKRVTAVKVVAELETVEN